MLLAALGAASLLAYAEMARAETARDWANVSGPSHRPPAIHGRFTAGCLDGASALAESGPGHQVVRLSRQRFYGHPALIAVLDDLSRRVAENKLGLMAIGDLGQPRGGPMTSGHSSHQIGLDADIYYRLDLPRLAGPARDGLDPVSVVDYKRWRTKPGLWGDDQAELVRLAAQEPAVARIFVHPVVKRALCTRDWPGEGREPAWLAKVRPWSGHDGHFHIRLSCPAGERDCVDQPRPAASTGCGAELNEWDRKRPPPPSPVGLPHPMPRLPDACRGVLKAP